MGSQDSDKWEIKLKIHRGICSDQMLGPKVSRDFVGFKNFSKQVRSFQIQFWVSIRNIQALQCHSEKKMEKNLLENKILAQVQLSLMYGKQWDFN